MSVNHPLQMNGSRQSHTLCLFDNLASMLKQFFAVVAAEAEADAEFKAKNAEAKAEYETKV